MLKVTSRLLMVFLLAGTAQAELVHYYSFDQQSARDSVGDSDGTIQGDPSFTSGATGKAGDFAIELNQEGTGFHDDYVSFEPEEFGDEFSISAWIRPNGEQDFKMMAIATNTHGGFAGPDGFKWTVNQWDINDSSLRLETGDTTTGTNQGTPGVLFEDEWQHVVITFDKFTLQHQLYVDSALIQTGRILEFGDNEPWQIGAFRPADNEPVNAGFIGAIDSVAIFDHVLDEQEVIDIFDNGIDVPPMELLGDFNVNGVLDAPDINDLTQQSASGMNLLAYDLNGDTVVNQEDIKVWIKDLFGSWVGDVDLNNEFNSADLIAVLASGTYQTGIPSVWTTGDFNGDALTTSGDLVAALADGGFGLGPPPAAVAVPEPSIACWFWLVCAVYLRYSVRL